MRKSPHALTLVATLVVALLALVVQRASAADYAEAKRGFLDAQKTKEWKVRRDAYTLLGDFDQAECVEVILSAMAKEQDPAVLSGGVATLSGYRSKESREVLEGVVRKEKGTKRVFVLLALKDQFGENGKEVLLEALKGSDGQAAMLAALALGKKGVSDAKPALLAALGHKDWQVRAAAARAIGMLGGLPARESLVALAAMAAGGEGRDRADAIATLETVTRQRLGWDPPAWKAIAEGQDPSKVAKDPRFPAQAFGIPVHGRRVVVVVDHSLSTDDPHPFTARERLQDVCKVPGGRDVPWYSIKTVLQLYVAHAKRWVEDSPAGTQFDLVSVGGKVKDEMGRLVPATAGSKAAAVKALEGLKPESGTDVYGALMLALDAGGKDASSWSSGPDEIVFMSSGMPFRAEIVDAEQVGAAVAFKARLRGVAIHTIGVGNHPFALLRRISDATGGRYLDLTK